MSDFDTQLKNARDKFREFSKEAETGIEKALVKGALAIEADAKKNLSDHVITGRLRDSITHRLGEEDGVPYAEIGSNVEYAPYVEMGTGIYAVNGDGRKTPWSYMDEKGNWHYTEGMPPVLFLTQAFEANKNAIEALITKAIKEAADNAGR